MLKIPRTVNTDIDGAGIGKDVKLRPVTSHEARGRLIRLVVNLINTSAAQSITEAVATHMYQGLPGGLHATPLTTRLLK